MSNASIKNIAIEKQQQKHAHFDLTHTISTTSNFGDCKPVMAQLMVPGSSLSCTTPSIVRMAPLVRPTYGKAQARYFHQFVGFSELLQNFPHLLAQTPVARGQTIYEIDKLPHISLGLLSYLVLIGSKCTIWFAPSTTQHIDERILLKVDSTTSAQNAVSAFDSMFGADSAYNNIFKFNRHSVEFPNFVGTHLWLWPIIHDTFGTEQETALNIPLANVGSKLSFFDVRSYDESSSVLAKTTSVSLTGADEILECEFNGRKVSLAFRLSDFGKRLKDTLLGLGYQVNFQSKTKVSAMPLFATWYAYYHQHGLVLDTNYFESNLYKLLTYLDYHNVTNLDTLFAKTEFTMFVNDLGSMWMTRPQDYWSAHIRATAIANPDNLSKTFIDVDGTANIDEVDNSSPYGGNYQVNGHSFIDAVKHGQLDAEYLKRTYQCTNIKTVLGRDLAKILTALGYGEFVTNCKSHFVGSDSIDIDFSIVLSQSNTFKEDAGASDGSALGDYAGFGLGRSKDPKSFNYETGEYGYWITLLTVIPESSMCQTVNPSLFAIDRTTLYNPTYDGLGYEATPKLAFVGSNDWTEPLYADEALTQDANAGYIPRYSGLKIAPSIVSGGFAQRSVFKDFRPYSLDRFIDVGEKKVQKIVVSPDDATIAAHCKVIPLLTPERLPVASLAWRYYTRYAFLGNYNRIFQFMGVDFTNEEEFFNSLETDDELRSKFEYLVRQADNLMIHSTFICNYWAPMKPIEMSFETVEDGGQPNMFAEKA